MLDVAGRCWTGTSNNDASREWHRASNSFRVSSAANPYLTGNLVLSNDVSVSGSGEAVKGKLPLQQFLKLCTSWAVFGQS